jgi:chromosome segregation ATPase
MYQKHSEKASRLDAIYSYKGDKLNVEDIDPEELKFALIKDPEKRAKFKIDMMKEEVENKRGTVQAQVDILVKNAKRLKQAESRIGSYDEDIADYEKELVESKADYDSYKAQSDKLKKAKAEVDWSLQSRMERAEYNVKRIKNNIRDAKNNKKTERDAIDTIRAKFDKMGIKQEADIDRKERQMLDEIEMYAQQLDQISKNRDKYVEEAKQQIARESVEARPLDELIKENVNSIITDLRPMDTVEAEIKAERGMKKSILLFTCRKTA